MVVGRIVVLRDGIPHVPISFILSTVHIQWYDMAQGPSCYITRMPRTKRRATQVSSRQLFYVISSLVEAQHINAPCSKKRHFENLDFS
jgi:hypothetical protein